MLSLVKERKQIAAQFPNLVDYESKKAFSSWYKYIPMPDDGSPINDCLGHPNGSTVDNIEDVDTVVGWMSESVRPHGFAISETQFVVFILNASRRLYSDGAVILYDYAEAEGNEELGGLTEVVSRQRVFAPVIKEYLERITYGEDGWP